MENTEHNQAEAQPAAEQLKQSALEQARKLRTTADSTKQHAAERVRHVGQALKAATQALAEQDQPAPHFADRAVEQIERAAAYVETLEPRALVQDAESLARRRPGVFYGGAFLLGLAAARFISSSRERRDSSASEAGSDEQTEGLGATNPARDPGRRRAGRNSNPRSGRSPREEGWSGRSDEGGSQGPAGTYGHTNSPPAEAPSKEAQRSAPPRRTGA